MKLQKIRLKLYYRRITLYLKDRWWLMHLKPGTIVIPICTNEDWRWRWWWHRDAGACNNDDDRIVMQWWWWWCCCHNDKSVPHDEDGSALLNTPSSVPPLCSSQGVLSLLFIEPMSLTAEEKGGNQFHLFGPCPISGPLAAYPSFDAEHTQTHTNLSDTSLALFC